jgi:rubrerythrin
MHVMHAMQEMQDQAAESRRHAEEFAALLDKAQRRFSALKRVEERHAQAYRDVLLTVESQGEKQ